MAGCLDNARYRGAGSLVRGLVVPFGDEALLLCFCGGGADLCLLSPEGFGCVGVEALDRSIELADGSVAGTFLLAGRVGFEDCPSGWLLVEKWDGIEGIGSVDTLCNPNPEGLPTIGEDAVYSSVSVSEAFTCLLVKGSPFRRLPLLYVVLVDRRSPAPAG